MPLNLLTSIDCVVFKGELCAAATSDNLRFGAKALTGKKDASVHVQQEQRNTSPATV